MRVVLINKAVLLQQAPALLWEKELQQVLQPKKAAQAQAVRADQALAQELQEVVLLIMKEALVKQVPAKWVPAEPRKAVQEPTKARAVNRTAEVVLITRAEQEPAVQAPAEAVLLITKDKQAPAAQAVVPVVL